MDAEKRKTIESLAYPSLFVAILWLLKLTEYFFNVSYASYGIMPRKLNGLPGIAISPLIHGNFHHLISNTLPLLILGIIICYFYRKIAFEVFFWVYVLTGIWVWVSADGEGYHIGASGLIYGFASFLLFSGLFRKDLRSIALALLVAFVYGGLVWGLLPTHKGVSWESHFFGSLSGGFCAYYYRKVDIGGNSNENDKKGTSDPMEEGNNESLQA